ncbi:hypothetical protein GGX14DRAFT_384127 [Mycena pura]|uniref:Uncharacterized protein n=1 Tax=Mycena pura TaxID=153505 RepID=A0AAD7E6B2_9AGAR|nr:hypothetical protein GGX14DRAFT_384127 [Mycena pura]
MKPVELNCNPNNVRQTHRDVVALLNNASLQKKIGILSSLAGSKSVPHTAAVRWIWHIRNSASARLVDWFNHDNYTRFDNLPASKWPNPSGPPHQLNVERGCKTASYTPLLQLCMQHASFADVAMRGSPLTPDRHIHQSRLFVTDSCGLNAFAPRPPTPVKCRWVPWRAEQDAPRSSTGKSYCVKGHPKLLAAVNAFISFLCHSVPTNLSLRSPPKAGKE